MTAKSIEVAPWVEPKKGLNAPSPELWANALPSRLCGTPREKREVQKFARRTACNSRGLDVTAAGNYKDLCLGSRITWCAGIDDKDLYGDDRTWRDGILSRQRPRFAVRLATLYLLDFSIHGRFEANQRLLRRSEELRQINYWLGSDEDAIKESARVSAQACAQIAQPLRRTGDATKLIGYLKSKLGPDAALPKAHTIDGAIARVSDPVWWRGRLRRFHSRSLETSAIRLNLVHRFLGLYVSNESLHRRREQRRSNREVLEALEAENEEGQCFTLSDLVARSTSNPCNRRAELMTRIAGFEQVADENGDTGVFITLTCPGYMHSTQWGSGEPNPNYDGSTPIEGQAYLRRIWSRIRAFLKRQQIDIYGMRIAEPHHDGTPHWHMLAFCPEQQLDAVVGAFWHYGMELAPNEPGAAKHRVKVVHVDKRKGTAAGYIAKYISKNIDGFGMTDEVEGTTAVTASERVEAWASTWGIRQFQQFGGPPVSPWRELRRVAPELCEPQSKLLEIVSACRANDWAAYVRLQGGISAKRREHPVSVMTAWTERLGRYMEPLGSVVVEIKAFGSEVITRLHEWTIGLHKDLNRTRHGLIMGNERVVNEVAGPPAVPGPPGGGPVRPPAQGAPCQAVPPLEFYQ